MTRPPFTVFDKRESLLESWGKDLVTFGFLLLCIYVSRDSRWWTFFTGCMAMLAVAGMAIAPDRKKCFRSKAELQAWVDSLDA